MDLRIERDPNSSEPCFYVTYDEDIVGAVYWEDAPLDDSSRSPQDGSWPSTIVLSTTTHCQDAFSRQSRLRWLKLGSAAPPASG
jgi:hypothetical protein